MFAADSISRFHPHHHLPTFSTTSTSYLSMNCGGSTDQPEIKHIWVITGPAGCGKTTVAQYLAKELSLPYVEGDDVRSSLVQLPYLSTPLTRDVASLGSKSKQDGQQHPFE
jgi:Rad17 P-loop domain